MRVFLTAIFLCLVASCGHPAFARTIPVERCDYWANSACLGSPSVIRAVTRAPMGYRLSLDGLPYQLAAKVQEIEQACGSRVISAYRPGARVRGSGRLSLHGFHEAADMQGNPSCIYARLQGWPGGYSTDYGRVRHVHISYSASGREMGARFAHWQPRHHHVRLAHR